MQNIFDVTSVDKHPFNYGEYEERMGESDYFGIAFFSDTHLGYSAYSHTNAKGINLRRLDGYNALKQIADGIVADPNVNAVIHGGDFFHSSHPDEMSERNMKAVLNLFASRGLPTLGQAGNHDVSDIREDVTPVSLLNDPSRKIHALWKPYQAFRIHEDIYLHAVSHHGLKADEAPVITPVGDALNIFSTHGAALDPKNATLMRCADSVREQFIPPEMVIDDNFVAKLLGHYHERYAVGGGQFNTWYAGSTIRRGFSDNEGARGWMLVKIFPDGSVKVENRNIYQRPQHDFKVIDAAGMNAAEVQQLVEDNILSIIDPSDTIFDELNAPIVRQQVINVPRSLRASINRQRFAEMTKNTLQWQLEMKAPELIRQDGDEAGAANDEHSHSNPSLVKGHSGAGGVEFFDNWVGQSNVLSQVPESQRKNVQNIARKHLEAAENTRGK